MVRPWYDQRNSPCILINVRSKALMNIRWNTLVNIQFKVLVIIR